ncbi:PAS and ANTAR domain-containing protein [Nocardia sp. BMG111209]|uniref:PAS and ANTAR domain-containing protein n=1 Tax=Nocardia sp. BMG111209 TaxID=1160137 RepID=UPI00036035AB|nr:PAS and ANTAR domain-containing protein [Nocardia sp. BMG111209]
MTTPNPSETPAHATADTEAGSGPVVGAFTFWFATRRWEWSPEVYRMHGYTPGDVEPSTTLLLSHVHPDDRARVADLITETVERGEPFSSRHRMVDVDGQEHAVMVVTDQLHHEDDTPVGVSGYHIDLTDTLLDTTLADTTDDNRAIIEHRAVIEQAKGVIMRTYGITADQAFKVLAWRSQETNVKLRDFAARLVAQLPTIPPPPATTAFDHLLLTAHDRVPPQPD